MKITGLGIVTGKLGSFCQYFLIFWLFDSVLVLMILNKGAKNQFDCEITLKSVPETDQY